MTDAQPTLAAAQVRAATGLTRHQLGELTSLLALDVGPRPNYPAYAPEALTLLHAATTLREVGMTLTAAAPAVRAYAEVLLAGRGWLVLSPTDLENSPSAAAKGEWTAAHAMDPENLAKLVHALGGRAVVIEVASIRRTAPTLRVGPQGNT